MTSDPQSAEAIRAAILRANAAENELANIGVDGVMAAWAAINHPQCESSANGSRFRTRAQIDESDRGIYTAFPDYHRTVHTIVVEPPFASFRWTMTGTQRAVLRGWPLAGGPIWMAGQSMAEFEDGLLRRSWVSLSAPQPGVPPVNWGELAPTAAPNTQTAAQIRETLDGGFRAEKKLAELGIERVLDALAAYFTPDWDAGANGLMHTHAQVLEDYRTLYSTLPPDYLRTIEAVVVEPPFAAYRYTVTATYGGGAVRMPGMTLAQFAGGRLRRYWNHVPSLAG